MAKHPVPKKKVSNARTASRYAAFAHKKHVKLQNRVAIVLCSSCGNPRLNQCACPECGMYNGRSVVTSRAKQATERIIKVKA